MDIIPISIPTEENAVQCHFKLKLRAASNMQVSNNNSSNATSQPKVKIATAAVTKSQNSRNRRRSRWKLKFHHQALPPEYLNHYEASLQSTNAMLPTPSVSAPPAALPLRTIAPAITSAPSSLPLQPEPAATTQLTNYSSNSQSQSSTVRYNDLPYMGEMTLDNARPRRGRKPKKADICHLIYKNYGTTIVDEPLNLCLRDLKSQTNANHISMCKFKFTAGAVPSLQEKKVLSVDSVNNLKLANLNHHNLHHHHHHNHHHHHRKETKRKSRKSIAREKLEKTFKEKGFLIQTQQLESAQGATYCKFRQLKKFTRYLFRSWKNHLPGDIVNNNVP